MRVEIIKGDCLEEMKDITDGDVDLILTDPPYGTTACKWDTVIPFDPMWEHLTRIIKKKGAILLFGSEPFSSHLRMSKMGLYKYDWIWNKKLAGNGILAKHQPLKIHELVHVFNSGYYYPQMTSGRFRSKMANNLKISEINGGDDCRVKEYKNDQYYPTSIQEFSGAGMRIGRLHPTQKPVELLEYLIKTYTKEGDTVLDFTAGSFSTAIACINTKRNFIGIELEDKYFSVDKERIQNHVDDINHTNIFFGDDDPIDFIIKE